LFSQNYVVTTIMSMFFSVTISLLNNVNNNYVFEQTSSTVFISICYTLR